GVGGRVAPSPTASPPMRWNAFATVTASASFAAATADVTTLTDTAPEVGAGLPAKPRRTTQDSELNSSDDDIVAGVTCASSGKARNELLPGRHRLPESCCCLRKQHSVLKQNSSSTRQSCAQHVLNRQLERRRCLRQECETLRGQRWHRPRGQQHAD